jgi:transcriptional repressor NrdR
MAAPGLDPGVDPAIQAFSVALERGWRDSKSWMAGSSPAMTSFWSKEIRSMRCPYCGGLDTQVKDSRPTEDASSIRRRRICPDCGGRFTTFERVQLRELMVVKRGGRRAPFDRDKLQHSVDVALRKRAVAPERVERMINGIVRQLESQGDADIPTERIGELVMEGLKGLDDVAYVRFASVYRNFREARDFNAIVGELSGEPEAEPGPASANPQPRAPAR